MSERIPALASSCRAARAESEHPITSWPVACPRGSDGVEGERLAGTGVPDGGVGIEDLLYYLSQYDDGTSAADVDDGTGTGVPDGGVGIEDLLYYLARYDAGC